MEQLLNKFKKSKSVNLSDSDSDSSDSSDSSSSFSTGDDRVEFYCRICNKQCKGKTEDKPINEVCKPCMENFPQRMFCKSCKRYFPNAEAFGEGKERCKSCWRQLESKRKARKAKQQGKTEKEEGPLPEKRVKKEKPDFPPAEENEDSGTYVAVFVKGKCIAKKNFKV